ncbi:MAG TPA: ABC-type transport auxiliary lipoprotein family protein [Chitinispirillaceae bacterium]|nr:ABC-type transport auxiliary lipoprotein family protein [Chitinispirillaceae bacterium]
MKKRTIFLVIVTILSTVIAGCGKMPVKQFYILNYLPSSVRDRLYRSPYPYTIRLRELDIEEAYNRPQIVYRQSPFQLRYYVYQVWAVKPTRMITDLLNKHLVTANIVSSIIRRFDEGPKPDFELNGTIESLEEYDSEQLWFAHMCIRLNLVRVKDGKTIYTRRFDHRKKVFQHEPEYVIREMSALMEYIVTQAIHDIDVKLAQEMGIQINQTHIDDSSTGLLGDSTITGE